jgi:uroporphyrinogen-III synthase
MSKKTIVITRPSSQAKHLAGLLSTDLLHHPLLDQAVPRLLNLPLLTIVPRIEPALAQQVLSALESADLAIFVSPNAIESTLQLIKRPWQEAAGTSMPVAVMGGGSLQALHNHGIGQELSPTTILMPQQNDQWDSEGLWEVLQSSKSDWSGRKVLIFKGEGGRDWLADTLSAAGALVEAIAVYSRAPLELSHPAWGDLKEIDFSQSLWLLTSSEAVRYLGQVMQQHFQGALQKASAICSHPAIASAAEQIGFGEVFSCEPGDAALVEATRVWLDSSAS